MPSVSVCIPAYREARYFESALSSVLGQAFSDFEVIVTDDSPGTEIASIVAAAADPRVIYVKNSRRYGVPGNWNVAAALANGEFVKFVHHDDWLASSESLGRFVDLLEQSPEADFAFSSSNSYTAGRHLQRVHSAADHISRMRDDPRHLLLGNWVGAPSATIYRRDGSLRFDENLTWVVDLDFYLAILSRSRRFVYCDEPLISVTDGASHQVTQQVAADPQLELYEWFYLYGKWAPRFALHGERGRFLDSLLTRMAPVSWSDFRPLGLRGRAARLFVTACGLHKARLLGSL